MLELTEGPVTWLVRGPTPELERLADRLKFRPENYWRAQSYQLYEQTHGESGWDGYYRPFKLRKPRGHTTVQGYLPRGLGERFLVVAETEQVKVSVVAGLRNPFANLVPDDIPDDLLVGLELDENQRFGVAEWLAHGLGVHNVTVGGGKTAMFAAAAELIKRKYPAACVLYVTHTERLVRQSYQEFCKFLPHRDISQFGGGVRNPDGKDIVISTNAILYRNVRELDRTGWLKKFTAVLYDECHHASSDSADEVLSRVTAYYRLGASDSVKEDDELARTKIEGHFGPVRQRVDPIGLILEGRLASPHIYIVDVPGWQNKYKGCAHAAVPDTPAWVLLDGTWKKAVYVGPVFDVDSRGQPVVDRKGDPVVLPSVHTMSVDGVLHEVSSRWCLLDRTYDTAIIRFKERNQLIADWAKYYSDQGWPTLVVATRTLHVLILESLIGKRVGEDKVRILFSDHSSKERDETFDWLRSTPGGVLVSPLVKEGVSINELRAGVIADPVSSWEYAKQLIGRFIRKKAVDNQAHITWFLDRQCPSYRRGCVSVFSKLETIRGFNFYHPVQGPDTVKLAVKFAAPLAGAAATGNQAHRAASQPRR